MARRRPTPTTAIPAFTVRWPLAIAVVLAALLLALGLVWDTGYTLVTVFSTATFSTAPPASLFAVAQFALLIALGLTVFGLFTGARPHQWRLLVILVLLLLALGAFVLTGFRRVAADAYFTVWRLPDLVLGVSLALTLLLLVGLWPQPARWSTRLWLVLLLALSLHLAYLVTVLDWEISAGLTPSVADRPIWLYPLLGGALGSLYLFLTRDLLARRGGATLLSLLVVIFWLLEVVIVVNAANPPPYLPLVFVAAALLLDASPPEWHTPARWPRLVALPVLFLVGFLSVNLPILGARAQLPALTALDVLWLTLALTPTLVLSAFLSPPLTGWLTAASQPSPRADH